jgi:homogentisate 1,2-dioxygenase
MLTCEPSASGTFQRTKIDEVRAAVIGGAAQLDASRWSQLSEQKQQDLQEGLVMVKNTLMEITRNADHKKGRSLLENESASTKSIIWLAIFGFIFAATLLSLIR